MQSHQKPHMPLGILISSCLMGFSVLSPSFCVPPMEQIVKDALHLTHAQTSLLYTGPIIMLAILAVPTGLIGDRIGARKAAGLGIVIIAIGSLLRGTASSPLTLIAYTLIYGIGVGWVYPNLPKLVSSWVQTERAGMATGIISAAIIAGNASALAITMPFVFPVTHTYNGVFYLWSIPPVLTAIIWWWLVKEPPRNRTEPIQKKTSFHVLKHKDLWLVFSFFLLHNFFFFAWAGWTPTLVQTKGAPIGIAGFMASISLWAGVPSVFWLPRLSYKIGLRKPFLWGTSLLLMVISVGAVYGNLSLSWIIMSLAGVAGATRFAMTIALPIEMFTEDEVGAASGLVMSSQFGGIIGSWAGGAILDLTGKLDWSFFLLAILSLVGVGLGFMLPETGLKAKRNLKS